MSGSLGDISEEIEKGTIPGSFNDNMMSFNFPVLKYLNQRKKEQFYGITVSLAKNGELVPIKKEYLRRGTQLDLTYKAIINVESGQDKVRESKPTDINIGKNIGKKNETNCLTQAIKEAYSKFIKQQDKTVFTATEARLVEQQPPPMLVQPFGKQKQDTWDESVFMAGVTAQCKFDGNRLVSTVINGSAYLYSRASKEYEGVVFAEEIEELYKRPEFVALAASIATDARIYLDGEAYAHGMPLNEIGSLMRNKGDRDTSSLRYFVYDMFAMCGSDLVPIKSSQRQEYLARILAMGPFKYLTPVANYTVKNIDDIIMLYDKFIAEGYEGVILRKDNASYEFSYNNLHSHRVLKYKKVNDGEFTIIGFKDGVGKDAGAIIWTCEVPETKYKFNVVPNQPLIERKKLFSWFSEHPEDFAKLIGKPYTIQYSDINKDTGAPQQPKGKAFRTYEDAADEVSELLHKIVL